MAALKRLYRVFSESPKFANRWGDAPEPVQAEKPQTIDLPKFPVSIDSSYKLSKSRVFDFQLPDFMQPAEEANQVWAMGDGMFSVNNVWIPGSILVFKDMIFQWDVTHPGHIQEYHFDIIRFMRPKLEYVIVGTGKTGKPILDEGILRRFQAIGLGIDYAPTVRDRQFEACGTFNLASDDRRQVCAALIPANIE